MSNPREGARAENTRKILALRAEGLRHREIAARLGLSVRTVSEYISDPTGEKWRRRREGYRGSCAVCGKPTTGSEGRRKAPTYCRDHVERRGPRIWTRERLLEAVRAWVVTYGEPPAMADWNGYHCQTALHDEGRAARYRRLRAAGAIPSFTSVYAVFGSWGAMLEAAGYQARGTTGSPENAKRMRKRPRERITHCKRGHEFTSENTRFDTRGSRVCRTCQNINRSARKRGILIS